MTLHSGLVLLLPTLFLRQSKSRHSTPSESQDRRRIPKDCCSSTGAKSVGCQLYSSGLALPAVSYFCPPQLGTMFASTRLMVSWLEHPLHFWEVGSLNPPPSRFENITALLKNDLHKLPYRLDRSKIPGGFQPSSYFGGHLWFFELRESLKQKKR